VIAERILLPVYKILAAADFQTVGLNRCAAVWRRFKADVVRRQIYRTIKVVVSGMAKRYADGHGQRIPVGFSLQFSRENNKAYAKSNIELRF
jgi:hypothetical protein